jgi:hypothetical protein
MRCQSSPKKVKREQPLPEQAFTGQPLCPLKHHSPLHTLTEVPCRLIHDRFWFRSLSPLGTAP